MLSNRKRESHKFLDLFRVVEKEVESFPQVHVLA